MAISSAVQTTSRARVVGIDTIFKNLRDGRTALLPQRVAVVGQGASAVTYPLTPLQVTSQQQAGTVFGFGSPVHLAVRELLPENGDGVGTIPVTVYPLEDDGGASPAAGFTTVAGVVTAVGSYQVISGGVTTAPISVNIGETAAQVVDKFVAEINNTPQMPIIASDGTTQVDFTAKWAGDSSNVLITGVTMLTEADTGLTVMTTQPTGGATDPDVQPALDQFGDVWETMVVNCLDISDSAALNAYQTFGEGRWGALVRKPLVVFTGRTTQDVASAITIPDARPTDRANVQITAPGAMDMPARIAARAVARAAFVANQNPPHDYAPQPLNTLTLGPTAQAWNYNETDLAIKAGASTMGIQDGQYEMKDTVTMYHPDGVTDPAYRYVVDIVKLQNIIHNLDLIFTQDEWNGAPLIPDLQPTTNPTAKQPKMARAEVAAMVDNLGLAAVISDPETAKRSILADINPDNPKRLDICVTVQLSGNTNIISVDLKFGFFFGTQTIVA